MGDDYFFGVTLSEDNKEVKWEPDELKENGSAGHITLTPSGEHGLVLKQALITEGKKGDVTVIEVETTGFKTASIKIPIAVLTPGEDGTAQQLLDATFPDPPVIIRLLKGSGPVHLTGMHVLQEDQMEEEEDDDSENEGSDAEADLEQEGEAEDEEVEEEPVKGKRNAANGKAKKRASNTSPNKTSPISKKKKTGEEA